MANRRTALVSARKSAGYTQESLAAALDVDRSTIIRWEAGDYAPLPYLRPKLGRLLRQSPEQLRDLIDGTAQAEPPLELNPDIDAACTWLDQQAGATPGSTRRQVRAVLQRSNKQELRDRRLRRAQVTRSEVTRALRTYYIDEQPPYELYTAHYGGQRLETTILTRPEWLDLRCPLVAASNGIRLSTNGIDAKSPCQLDITAATQRLAEAQTFDTRLTNDPLYRLIDADIEPGTIKATVGLAPFVEYALTMDLLEGEILDALADGRQVESGALPLRDRYLPTLDAVMDFPARLCVGGVLALLAIARPAGINGEPDYLFLVQVRSSHALTLHANLPSSRRDSINR